MGKVKIFGYQWDVESNLKSDEFGHFGRCIPAMQKIIIASDLCDEQKISTLLHEIIEAIGLHLELDLEHSSINSLEAALFTALKENGVDLTPLLRIVNE